MFAIRLLLFGYLLAQSLAAQTGIEGPVLGFVYDPANGLQPIRGISGALTVGTPLDLAGTFSKLVVAPQQDYALAVAASDSPVFRLGLRDRLSIEELGIPFSRLDVVAMSPTGSGAAFYDRERNRVQVVAGLPAHASLIREFDLTAFPGALASLAVNDSADAVIVGFSGVDHDAVVALGVDGTVRTLPGAQAASAITFLNRTGDVLIADSAANRIYLVKDATGAPEARLLADETQGISGPVAVAASKDNKHAFVVSAGIPGVATIDLASGGVTLTPCACSASQLTPLNGNAIFRLTEPSRDPMWLFDGDGGESRIVFVPPYKPAEENSLP